MVTYPDHFLLSQSSTEREWLTWRYEEGRALQFPAERRQKLAEFLIRSEVFDNFLNKKFGLKGYGGEGAESMMGFFQEVFLRACEG